MRTPTREAHAFGAEEDQALQRQQELAVELIGHLCALAQAGRLYELNNDVVVKILAELHACTSAHARLTGEGMVLSLVGHSVFINRRLVRLDFNQYRKAQQLLELWKHLGIGELALDEGITLEGLTAFTERLFAALNEPHAIEGLFLRPVGGVLVRRVIGDDTPGERQDPHAFTLRVYCALVALMRTTLVRIQAGKSPPILRIKRALQVLVDLLDAYQHRLLALTQSPVLERDLAVHLVNTAVLSLLVGKRMALGRGELMGLATAALFHDLPKAGLKAATLNSLERPDTLAPGDLGKVEMRWLNSLRRMVDVGGFTDEMLARLVVIFESQLEFGRRDLYPEGSPERGRPSLFARVVALSNAYDTLTWAREGKPRQTSHRALLALLNRAGAQFEPGLVRAFMELVGLYPVGSVVLLSTGEIAVVKNQGTDPRRPGVQVVVDARGTCVEGMELELEHDRSRDILWPLHGEPIQLNPVSAFRDAGSSSGARLA